MRGLSGAWGTSAMKKHHSKFLPLSAVLLAAVFIPSGDAQTGTQTTVLASPSGPWFEVDGTVFYSAMSAFWPIGSMHTLSIPGGTGFTYSLNATTQWQLSPAGNGPAVRTEPPPFR